MGAGRGSCDVAAGRGYRSITVRPLSPAGDPAAPVAVAEEDLARALEVDVLDEVERQLGDSLPAGVRIDTIQVERGSIEIIVVVAAAYGALSGFNEVVRTLREAAETLPRFCGGSWADGIQGALNITADFVVERNVMDARGVAAIAAIDTLTGRRGLRVLVALLLAAAFLSLLGVLVAFLLSRF